MTHDWHDRESPVFGKTLTLCRTCGIVKRRDGGNGPCKGPVMVGLRGKSRI